MDSEVDPLAGFFNTSWADVGGWSLFIGLAIFLVIGAYREWWVPGPRYRRTQELLDKSMETTHALTVQNGQLITANEITKHFFEETTPKRERPRHTEGDGGESP